MNTGGYTTSNGPTMVRQERNPDGTSTVFYSDGVYSVAKHDESGNLIYSKFYNAHGRLCNEQTQEGGKRIGKDYDQDGRVTCLHNEEKDENGNTIVDKFTHYEYGDNGNISSESVYDHITGETTIMKYDDDGNQTEKLVKKGAVTTYYDAGDKPVRRETFKGAGIVETENLE